MNTIDWTKPILVNGAKGRVLSVFKGSAFVTWNDEIFATSFDKQGRRYGCSYPEVTNVPKEPTDTICLHRRHGEWNINAFGKDGTSWAEQQVAPRSVWEKQYPRGLDDDHVLVKVPV